jgi:hypothetical protein
MCYNCGCGEPQDDHGKGHMGVDPGGKAITDKTIETACRGFQMDTGDCKQNMRDLLQSE